MDRTKRKEDFLYQRMGPWPQPCPEHPLGEAPAVLRLPFKEKVDWWLHVGSRYVLTLAYSPIAYLKALLNPGLEVLTDEDFLYLLTERHYSKFIKPELDDRDREQFEGELGDDKDTFIVDLEPVRVVKPLKGIYVSPTKTLLHRTGEKTYELIAIFVEQTDTVLKPEDGDNWELAKYFVLQGAALCATLVEHPLLHFPMDSINAITKTALPKDHLLFRLLYPHLRFTLCLENAVLTFPTSLLANKWWMTYGPYPGGYDGLRDLLVEGFVGDEANDSYNGFHYPAEPVPVHSKYGDYQNAYFAVIREFIEKVCRHIQPGDPMVSYWADHCAHWVKGFPNGKAIWEEDNLVNAVAYYLYDVTVGHAIDHYDYGLMDIRKVPLRLRQPPPGREPITIDRKRLVKFWDTGKYDMAQRLFFGPTNVTRLITTEYDFDDPEIDTYVEAFHEDLRELDKRLDEAGINYMPLWEVPASIQY
jgi:hypothetical protein